MFAFGEKRHQSVQILERRSAGETITAFWFWHLSIASSPFQSELVDLQNECPARSRNSDGGRRRVAMGTALAMRFTPGGEIDRHASCPMVFLTYRFGVGRENPCGDGFSVPDLSC